MELPERSAQADELIKMSEADQAMRKRGQETNEWDGSVDEVNTARLKEIVATHGWPKVSNVGKEAASAAWLLAQHADHDPEFQAQCLNMMKQLPPNEVDPTNLAYLEDRVRVNTGRPQLYGTQFHRQNGRIMPQPIEDEAHVEQRRKAIGLKPLSEYAVEIEKIFKERDKVINTKKQSKG